MSTQPLYALAKSIHGLGSIMIADDASDIGYLTYTGRNDHYYHGVHSPNHESPFHHWQWGGMLVLLSHLLGTYAMFKEMTVPENDVPQALFSVTAIL